MALDLFFLALALLLALLGLFSGFLRQVVRIAALVAACFLAVTVSPHAKGLLARWMEVETLLGDALSLTLAWLGCYIVLALAGRILVRLLRGSSHSIRFFDRLLGFFLGGAKGLLAVYLMACVLATFRGPIEKTGLGGKLGLRDSRVVDAAVGFNLLSLTSLPDMDKLRELTAALGDPVRKQTLIGDPRIRNLQQNPAFQQLLTDGEFQEAAGQKFGELVRNKRFRQALKDAQIRELLSKWIAPGESPPAGKESPPP